MKDIAADDICATLPNADPEALMDAVANAIRGYEKHREFSRDTFPTGPQVAGRVQRVVDHLDAALAELLAEPTAESTLVIGLLSAPADGSAQEGSPANFLEALFELRRNATEFLAAGDGVVRVDGSDHVRKTRTAARDDYLIPILTLTAQLFGDLEAPYWDDLDEICAFIEAVLCAAGIPSPDAGDTSRSGESSQGRLRRLVKSADQYNRTLLDK